MFRSDGDRRSFSLTRDITVIGRREDCDLRIPLGEVSRKHCRLVRDGDSLRLEDLGSSNGTYHNAQRVQEAILSPGDSVQVGPLVFVLQIDGAPPDDELAPVSAAVEEGHEDQLLADSSPLQPTAQSEFGGGAAVGELPTLDAALGEDQELEPIESLEDADALVEAEPLGEPEAPAEMEAMPAADDEHGLQTTQPLGLEAPPAADDDLSFDELTASELHVDGTTEPPHAAGEAGAAAQEGDEAHAAGHDDDPLAIDDLDLEQAHLDLDEDEDHHGEHEPLKIDSEHESPHPH